MTKTTSIHKITATLPVLGKYTIPFYKESSKILQVFGQKEINRLNRIPHLGTAISVFTGVNHSRLEYMLLQCAMINLLSKFNRSKEEFATSAKVRLTNERYIISSGEELLKCWAILNNIGHAQYTYGVEKSLFSYLTRTKNSKKFFLSMITKPSLKEWSEKVINNYEDVNFHWILAIIRLLQIFPNKSKYRSLFLRCFQYLLLPLEELDFQSHSDRYKIYRLRNIYSKIRLLSLVTIDSYYSHHPIRYQVSTAIMDLENLFSEEETGFEKILIETASWLADELYMHPKSAATLRNYEIMASQKFYKNKYNKFFTSPENFKGFMSNFMNSGLGSPSNNCLKVFLRISLSKQQTKIFQDKNTYEIRNLLERKIRKERKTRVSVLRNPFSKKLHIDLLYFFS